MLSKPVGFRGLAQRRRPMEQGVVLIVALIMLVALALAGVALMRSVSSSNIIAGNLAFQQAATHSADQGVEAAIAFLEANASGTTLQNSILSGSTTRYVANRQDPAAGVSWDTFFTTLTTNGAVNTMATDAAGNTVSYVIHRLCNTTGAPSYPGCSASPVDIGSAGNSFGANVVALTSTRQVYYRITARVAGPRNTVSYVQAVVAM